MARRTAAAGSFTMVALLSCVLAAPRLAPAQGTTPVPVTTAAASPRTPSATATTAAATTPANRAAATPPAPSPARDVAPAPHEVTAGAPVDVPLEQLRAEGMVQRRVPSDGTPVRTAYAATLVHRPAAQVLATLHDVDHYREFVPRFVQSQQLRRSRASQELFVRLAIGQLLYVWARVRYDEATLPGGAVEITGHALQGNLQRMDVRWRVTPVDGGADTVLEFWSLLLPALPVPIPTAILDREQEQAARMGIRAVRDRVEGVTATNATSAPRTVPAAAGATSL